MLTKRKNMLFVHYSTISICEKFVCQTLAQRQHPKYEDWIVTFSVLKNLAQSDKVPVDRIFFCFLENINLGTG